MSHVPADLKYLKSHEWVRADGDGRYTVGISDHAQAALGDLVYVELPAEGDELAQGAGCAVVESVKAASDVYAPLSGKVVAVNAALADSPETINADPYGQGWMFTVEASDPAQLDTLLTAEAYAASIAG
ncbi:MAG: glycine cleavage system protein GcvH [Xanthomonadaceae bacterium]|jgi:glycine cleavage system H protein|nr:glycine cleavage system protein GcvH [Xanthomonadaceae bacterium]